jgi:coenzyme F420 hydrogenase subunit beta
MRLLETKVIDAAVVCVPDEDLPPRGRSLLATTRDQLILGSKSIYGMTEISIGLGDALSRRDIARIAVVGLPCQVASVKRASELIPKVRSKVSLSIGLMDGHNVYHKATEYAIRKQGIRVEEVAAFRYRASGWSGSTWLMEIATKGGKGLRLPWDGSPFAAIWNAALMVPRRCLLCNDFAAESADIAVADAWLPEFAGNPEGYSIVLAHSERGVEVVQNLRSSGCLELEPQGISVIGRSQYVQLDFKKRTVAARARLLGMKEWLGGRSLGTLTAEDYLTQLILILKNSILRSAPALAPQIFLAGSRISRLEGRLLQLIMSTWSKVPKVGKHARRGHARFGPEILART